MAEREAESQIYLIIPNHGSTPMRRILPFVISLILVEPYVNATLVKGQIWKGYEALSAVPDEERVRLSERLKSLIECQSSEQWDKVYEFLPNPKSETKDYYIGGRRKRKPTKLEAFIPRNTAFIPPSNAWGITGCATFRENGAVRERPAITYAIKQDGEWYLFPIGRFLPEQEKEPFAQKLCSK